MPSGVRDVVRRRIALLPEGTIAMLQVAAVIGRDVELDLLTAASGDAIDTVLDAIEPAVVHRLLAPCPNGPQRSASRTPWCARWWPTTCRRCAAPAST